MHACHGHRSFTRLAVVQRYDAAAINAPGNVVFVLARSDTRIALDAAVSCHTETSYAPSPVPS